MASIGLPGLANFPGEFMVFFSGFAGFSNGFGPVQIATILCLWGLVIGAVYMLRAYRNIFQGDLSKASAYATGLQPSDGRPTASWSSPWRSSASSPRWCSSFSPDFLPSEYNPSLT